MRHGPAEDASPTGRDSDRSLSDGGRARTEVVARALSSRGERPARIVSSPLRRALQTAEIVAKVLGGSVEIMNELAPSETAPDVVRDLLNGDRDSVLLVGHAPDVSMLVSDLTGKRQGGFEPAMVVAIDLDRAPSATAIGRGTERFVIRPSVLSE
jgi:phosphohistidine phosphatase